MQSKYPRICKYDIPIYLVHDRNVVLIEDIRLGLGASRCDLFVKWLRSVGSVTGEIYAEKLEAYLGSPRQGKKDK